MARQPARMVDRLVWHELTGPILNSFFMFLVLLFSSVLLFQVTDLLVRGASMGLVARYAMYGMPMLVTQSLPMAMLLGSLLAFGRLSGDSEHIALFAGGISFYRMVVPVAWVGLAVSVLAFAWNETVVPPATRQFYDFKRNVMENIQESDRAITYNVMRKGGTEVDEFVNIAGGYDPRARKLRRVMIVKLSDDPDQKGRPVMALYADSAVFRGEDPSGLNADFYDVDVYYLNPNLANDTGRIDMHYDMLRAGAVPQKMRLGRTFKGVQTAGADDNRTMSFNQLRTKIQAKTHESGAEATLGDQVDLWGKLSMPLASLIFGLVGAPLGIRPQRGSRTVGFGVAIAIIFMYWMVYNWMYQVGKGGGLPPALASFSADLLGIAAAVFLVGRTRQ